MKRYEKKTTTSTYNACVEQTCDLCGIAAERPDSKWLGSCYDVDETEIHITIHQKEGSNYPEGGSGTEYNIDMCPTCFKTKLIPWLREQGAKVEETNWDW